MTKHYVTPVAESVPHTDIVGMETSSNVQQGLAYLFKLFRDVLREPTGFVNKYQDSTLAFNNSTLQVSIAPKTTSFEYYIRGKVYTVTTTQTVSITDSEGLWYFYFDANGVFRSSQTPWSLANPIAVTATGYWDADNNVFIRKNEERHGVIMDADTHRLIHRTEGSKIDTSLPLGLQIGNYVLNGNGSSDSHAQYSISNGTYFDEDIDIGITNATTPANPFEQRLSPIAYIPVFYLDGTDKWRKKTATQFPFCDQVGNLACYNMFNGTTWSRQTCTNNYYFATWLIYTDDLEEPVISILGQRQDDNIITAVNNNTRADLVLPRKFSEEFYYYKKLIWQTSTSYTNTPKTRLVYIATGSEIAATNDRYAAICSYNGNATLNKYLEFYPGQSSDLSPYPIPEPSYLKTIILTAIANSTGTISIYRSTDLVNPITTISLSNSKFARTDIAVAVSANDLLVAKLSSGSINKPAITIFIQTNL